MKMFYLHNILSFKVNSSMKIIRLLKSIPGIKLKVVIEEQLLIISNHLIVSSHSSLASKLITKILSSMMILG